MSCRSPSCLLLDATTTAAEGQPKNNCQDTEMRIVNQWQIMTATSSFLRLPLPSCSLEDIMYIELFTQEYLIMIRFYYKLCAVTFIIAVSCHKANLLRPEQSESTAAVHDNQSASVFHFQNLTEQAEDRSSLIIINNCSRFCLFQF